MNFLIETLTSIPYNTEITKNASLGVIKPTRTGLKKMRPFFYKETNRRAKILFPLHAVVLIGIGLAEYFFTPAISMLLFYVIVIISASWFIGKKWGIAGAVIAALTELAARLPAIAVAPFALVWDLITILALGILLADLIVYTRKHMEAERDLIRKDYLTGIDNIRSFYEDGALEMERCRRNRVPLTIVYMDINDLESLNDALGHRVGDRALQSAASAIRDSVRMTDIVARIGGDEFAVLLPGGDFSQSSTVIERLHTAVSNVLSDKKWPVTVTTAAITYLSVPDSIDHLVKSAEESMMIAKQSGTNAIRHNVVTKLQLIVGEESQNHEK
jgi:diguanylate cyclase (GGDEF)-like protein